MYVAGGAVKGWSFREHLSSILLTISEPSSHVLGSLSSYKLCCGHYLPLAGKAEMPVICFSSLTPSLALLQLELKCIV